MTSIYFYDLTEPPGLLGPLWSLLEPGGRLVSFNNPITDHMREQQVQDQVSLREWGLATKVKGHIRPLTVTMGTRRQETIQASAAG